MENYIGVKLVQAEPAKKDGLDGYKVFYDDGYESWCPKDIFEKHNFRIESKDTISPADVERMIQHVKYRKIGDRTAFVMAELQNGFLLSDSSSCVNASHYDEKIGQDICMDHIQTKVWEFLGFLLTSAKGFKRAD